MCQLPQRDRHEPSSESRAIIGRCEINSIGISILVAIGEGWCQQQHFFERRRHACDAYANHHTTTIETRDEAITQRVVKCDNANELRTLDNLDRRCRWQCMHVHPTAEA